MDVEPFDPAIPPPPPRPRWHPLARCVLFLVAFVVAQVLAVLLLKLVFRLAGRELGNGSESLILVFAVTAPLLVLLTLPFLRWLDRRGLASLGARWPEGGPPRALRQAVAVPLSVLALLGLWLLLVEVLPATDVQVDGVSPAAGTAGGLFELLLLLLGFLCQGGVEEWVFRGYMYHALKERWRWWVAALVTSAGFALLHAANPDFSAGALINTFLAGFLLAVLVERSGSLWSATLAHGVWNFAVASLASLPVSGVRIFHLLNTSVSGPEAMTGGGFGPEGSLLLTGLGVVLLALLWPRPSPPAPLPQAGEGGKAGQTRETGSN
jgi:membrane protease YdiL (CAAX protease family)